MVERTARASKVVRLKSSETMESEEGRQYHIGLAKGELAENILLCGDLARARKTADKFDEVEFERQNREYITFTGTWKGMPISVMSTGIGCDNTEIAIVEIAQITKHPTLIRIGSSGALQPYINLGDLVVSTSAVRLENTSLYFVPEGYPAVADYRAVSALVESCNELGIRHHAGITATAPGFYGAQSRDVKGFAPRFPSMPEQLASLNVLNFEMESSTLFTLASMKGFVSGSVCAIYAQRAKKQAISSDLKMKAEENCIKVGMNALLKLDRPKS